MPGAKHLNYYICSGEDPSLAMTTSSKFRGIMYGIYIVSALLHLVIKVKIEAYKHNDTEARSVVNLPMPPLDSTHHCESKTSKIMKIVLAIFLFGGVLLTIKVSNVNPFEINLFHNMVYIYSVNIFLPPFFIFSFGLDYYLNHPLIHKTILKQFNCKVSAEATINCNI
jgi:hypothetical protein